MKRLRGRGGIGLALVSITVGACVADQEARDVPASAVAQQEAAHATVDNAQDVVLAMRTQLSRAFGRTSENLYGTNGSREVSAQLGFVGTKSVPSIDIFGKTALAGEIAKTKADLNLPDTSAGAFRLRDHASGVTVDVGLVGATAAAREDVNGFVVYRAGYMNSAHIVHRPTAQGTEDYVFFPDTLPEKSELRYKLGLGDSVAGLRLVGGTLEMLDKAGAPRLRMAPPYAVDGSGRRLAMNVAIEGCAFDDSAALPWDRPTVNPGARECMVRLNWPADAKAPLVVDPMWHLTSDMIANRFNATSAPLPSAAGRYRVIVVGGDLGQPLTALDSTEIYDDATSTWATGPQMKENRTEHAMAYANIGASGFVIVAVGGRNEGGEILSSGEKLGITSSGTDPTQVAWTLLGQAMMTARTRPTAAFFDNGGKIFVAGGFATVNGTQNVPQKTIELADLNTWLPAQSVMLTVPRAGHALAQVSPATNGSLFKAFLVGGISEGGALSNTIERCEATPNGITCTSTISQTNPMPYAGMAAGRINHVAIYAEQTVHVMGGNTMPAGGTSPMFLDTVECFNPNTGTWGLKTSTMSNPRAFFTATPSSLVGGKYVVAGGESGPMTPTNTVDLYDPVTETFTKGFSPMHDARSHHTAVTVPDGRVFVVGGAVANAAMPKGADVLMCTSDSECEMGTYCANTGICTPTKLLGQACNLETDCWGGACADATRLCEKKHCADGYCCDQACDGQCEACDGTGLTEKVGKCQPVLGSPTLDTDMMRMACNGDAADVCGGKCDGINVKTCTYPLGNQCSASCNPDTNTAESTNCDGMGFCSDVHAVPCGLYVCDGKECGTKCVPATDTDPGSGCDEKNAVCNVNGQCVSRPTTCMDDNTMVLANGQPESCGNYRCDPAEGKCLTVCDTAYDCNTAKQDPNHPIVCNDSRQCVETTFDKTVDEVTGCSTSPARESSRFGWLAAIAFAGVMAKRRNRARA